MDLYQATCPTKWEIKREKNGGKFNCVCKFCPLIPLPLSLSSSFICFPESAVASFYLFCNLYFIAVGIIKSEEIDTKSLCVWDLIK